MAEGKHRVVIVEDQTLMREGLRALLSSQVDLEVVGECADGREAIRVAEKLKPDLMVMALSLPRSNGLESLNEVKRVSPGTRILVLAVERDEEDIFAALQAGAYGYGLKDSTSAELFTAVKSLLAGEKFLSPAIATTVVTGYLGDKRLQPISSSLGELSAREREILKLVAEGYRTKAIGVFLCISPKTVEKHRANLMKKLDLHTVPALTTYAIKKGMVAHCPYPAPEVAFPKFPGPFPALSR